MKKNCEVCGTPMGDVHYSRRFCSECSLERRKKQVSEINKRYAENAKQRKKLKQDKPKEPKKKPRKGCWDLENKSAVQVDIEARALGLSYGQYSCLIDTLMIERHLADVGIHDGLDKIDEAWRRFKQNKRQQKKRIDDSVKLNG